MTNNNQLRQAKILFASGRLEKSIEFFKKAEKSGCDRVDLCLSRGAAYMAMGKFSEARDDFSRVLDENENNERAYYYRGITQAALGMFEQAIDDLTMSLIRNHNRGIAHLVRGLAYSELGREQDAVLDFNSASAFSEAELQSFSRLFGSMESPFANTKALLSKENAPWNNLLPRDAAYRLSKLLK